MPVISELLCKVIGIFGPLQVQVVNFDDQVCFMLAFFRPQSVHMAVSVVWV